MKTHYCSSSNLLFCCPTTLLNLQLVVQLPVAMTNHVPVVIDGFV